MTVVLFAALAGRYDFRVELLAPSALAAAAVPLAVQDARTRRLPNPLVAASYILVTSAVVTSALLSHSPDLLLRVLAGALALLTFCGALYVLFPGQLGGGDVKLAGTLGATLAATTWTALFIGFLLGWLLAALAQLTLRLTRRSQPDQALPLGAFLIAGTFAALLTLPPNP